VIGYQQISLHELGAECCMADLSTTSKSCLALAPT
jgi:hypothetical protein